MFSNKSELISIDEMIKELVQQSGERKEKDTDKENRSVEQNIKENQETDGEKLSTPGNLSGKY